MERKQQAATESGVLLLVIAAILVAVNALSALGVYKRYDSTQAERFTLSKGSGNLLKSMKQPLKADVYVTKGLPKLDAYVRDLRDLLQEYKDASGGKFEYQIIEAKDEETKKTAKEAGLVEQPFGEASDTEDKAAVTQGFMGLVLKYGAEKDAIKFLDPNHADGLEFWITNKIREIRDRGDDVKHKIGVLTGHDEMKLTESNLVPAQMGKPSMQEIITRNFPFYSLQDVDLKGGDGDIDDALDGLIISQPQKDLTEKELRKIDAFVLKGKSLAIFASARFPQFMEIQDDTRFTGDEQLLDTAFPGFFRIPTVVVPFASSLALHAEKQPDAKPRVIARSTPRSTLATGDTVDLKPLQQWTSHIKKAQWAQYAVGATLEGTIKSAFADSQAKSAKSARVMVVSSSQFLANPFARAGNGPDMGQFGMQQPMGGDEQLLQLAGPYASQALTGTILAFKNTLDWLSGDTDLLAVSAKILSEPSLVYGDVSKPKFDENETEEQLKKRDDEMKQARKTQQHTVEGLLILGLPLLFALYGVLRWRMRLTARENVSLA